MAEFGRTRHSHKNAKDTMDSALAAGSGDLVGITPPRWLRIRSLHADAGRSDGDHVASRTSKRFVPIAAVASEWINRMPCVIARSSMI